MKVISVVTVKGGVAKTTTAINLAALAAADGHKVLCVDMDNVQDDLMDFDGKLKGVEFSRTVPSSFDGLVFVDCAPFLDPRTSKVIKKSTLLIVPLQPERKALKGASRILRDAPAINPGVKCRALLTLCLPKDKEDRAEVLKELGGVAFDTVIPHSYHVIASMNNLRTLDEYAPRTAPARAYKKIWREINELD